MTKFNLIENKEIMKKIHSRVFKILDYFVEICEKNNFVYFLSYGLPLGIFRENKIID
jgi:phosphorylcholine metabolism protein LicD